MTTTTATTGLMAWSEIETVEQWDARKPHNSNQFLIPASVQNGLQETGINVHP